MQHDEEIRNIVADIAEMVDGHDVIVACAESLTAGQIATALGAGESSSEWFAGGVVAYQRETKYRMLGVPEGPVVSPEAAKQMARGVAEHTAAQIAVAVTGVGGPDRQDDEPVGTVFIAVHTPDGDSVVRHQFDGEPVEILRKTTVQALRDLADAVKAAL